MTNTNECPYPADLLFKNLFENCTPIQSLGLISEGLSASYKNAGRLLSDTQFLIKGGRLSSARFLLTTAREEIAKSFILMDACRLDMDKHNSDLRKLCKAFYNHISKHAYLEFPNFPNVHTMVDAKNIWEIETKRWWPAMVEDGEPSMPHDTHYDREFPLYIDFGDYDCCWLVPADTDQSIYFEDTSGESPISNTQKLIEQWNKAESIGICSPKVLAILNNVFKKHYLSEDTTQTELYRLYEKTAQCVSVETGISTKLFLDSPIVQWPLYRFV